MSSQYMQMNMNEMSFDGSQKAPRAAQEEIKISILMI